MSPAAAAGGRGPRKPAAAKKAPAKKPAARKRAPRNRTKPPEPLTAVRGVEQDLADIAALDAKLATSALAASALELARMIDNRENSATSRAMCARALAETMSELRALAPPAEEKDALDDLADRRRDRLAAGRAAS